ncbi:hypothetical protein [Bacillus sp. AFS088145]|uniref:hypothetical protein n=1 Tax=Bacillus sp. AFS088145 TaxID=2033514 RepID=UPI000BF5BFC1|nr:hypothetical protein [Bacillus sp. AFS088145]PFH81987.1 hypothetical protein COI44_22145 [Bacillus sp. AFS088145]
MKNIVGKIDSLMIELGFKKVNVNNTLNYLHNGLYLKVIYVEGLKSYVIESACSSSEAERNVYEDSELYPITLGENKLLETLRNDLMTFYITDKNT